MVYWACSREYHKNEGQHYHLSVKLFTSRRRVGVRHYLDKQKGVKVHFSDLHANYYSAWRYTTKKDSEYLESENHPDLMDSPSSTQRASETLHSEKRSGRKGKKVEGKRRRARLSVFDVSQISVKKRIKTRLEFMVLAKEQMEAGKSDLAKFIANRGVKVVEEAIRVGWEMEEADKKLQRSKMSRMEVLRVVGEGECADGCNGQWYELATDILSKNNLTDGSFQEAVRNLLEKGRGNYRNVILKGGANCGKTFLLNPLIVIYRAFCNPARCSFAWVGVEDSEVVFLNDFRWSPAVLP